jgi:hypothetical protein
MEMYVSLQNVWILSSTVPVEATVMTLTALQTKSSITVLKPSQHHTFSMDNAVSPANHSCGVVERNYNFMSLNFETLLSADATGAVCGTIHTPGYTTKRFFHK